MANLIDQFMFAVASLEAGTTSAEETFGVTPAYGGEHVGLGTRNTLLSLGDTDLEIIVPDPEQDLIRMFGEKLSRLSEPALVAWAVQGDLNEISVRLSANGMQRVGPNRTERKTGVGDLLVWELFFPIAGSHGARMPFFIDRLDCPHPAAMNPDVGTFKSIRLRSPDSSGLSRALESVDLEIEVTEGKPAITVEIESRGLVTLTSPADTRALSVI